MSRIFSSRLFNIAVLFSILLAVLSPAQTAGSAAAPAWQVTVPSKYANQVELEQKAQAAGSLPVIVMLAAPFRPEGGLAPQGVTEQRSSIQSAQDNLLAGLDGYDPTSVKRFATIPFLSLSVTPAGLARLEMDPGVLNIELDVADPPALSQSVPFIGAPAMWDAGYTGAGQVVAVLDTGVDKTHPFLAGKVVSEACYSTTNDSFSSQSLCPGGAASSIDIDSALPYASGACPVGACDHGTHVAGIAAGHSYDNAQGKVTFDGMAKDAQIIAIQVFSAFPLTDCPNAEACVMSFTSDQILGLERVLELSQTYSIAAANLSFGGGDYDDQAECDSQNAARKAIIDNLRSAGIATVVASGNGYSSDSLDAPACISSAVSVGSTDDGAMGTIPDVISAYSNVAPFLTLLAPGEPITSSIPYGQYATWAGTSMATPHVAGAWAILKQKYPLATVDQLEALLVSSGEPIADNRYWSKLHVIKPRLSLEFAVTGRVTAGSGADAEGVPGITVSADPAHTTITGSDGTYTLTGLALGSYTIGVSLDKVSFNPDSRTVTGGPDQTDVDFSATRLIFAISGKVTQFGQPGSPGLAGVTVSAGDGHVAVTGPDGSYLLEDLVPGTYQVTPSLPEYCFAPSPKVLVLAGAQNPDAVNFSGAYEPYQIHLPFVSN